MSTTPRAKPTSKPEGASPRAAPAAKSSDKKPKAKKPKGAAPTAPVSLGMPMNKPADMTEDAAKADLEQLQQKYGALVVNFNNQQAELAAAQKQIADLTAQNELLRQQRETPLSPEGTVAQLEEQLAKAQSELRALESQNMTLQKKVNKLQVEHVSEEEVDQLFFALEKKEQELEQARNEKDNLEQEVLTARQLSARGGGGDPKFIEIHHHNDISDDDDDDDADKKTAEPAVEAS